MKNKKSFLTGFSTGWIGGMLFTILALFVTLASARNQISVKDITMITWVLIIVGGIIILLQLIPAALLFFSFFAERKQKEEKKNHSPQRECKTCGNTRKISCPACGDLMEWGTCACCHGNKEIDCPDCNPKKNKEEDSIKRMIEKEF